MIKTEPSADAIAPAPCGGASIHSVPVPVEERICPAVPGLGVVAESKKLPVK